MNPFNNFSMQIYTPEMIDALEKELLSVNERPSVDWSRESIMNTPEKPVIKGKHIAIRGNASLFYKITREEL